MRIRLSSKQLIECSRLQEAYKYSESEKCIQCNIVPFLFEKIKDVEHPLYRDFLQLVIEGIEKKEIAHFEYDYYNNLIQIFNDRTPINESYLETVASKNLIGAKEKAIAYVIDNAKGD